MHRTAIAILLLSAIRISVSAADDLKRMEWTVEGVTREALIYAPAAAKATPSPVVFAFHGHGGKMQQAAIGFA